MPQYLVTVEQEGIAYPFLLDASERGRAIAQIKHYWEEQGWGAYDALHIELMRKDRQGIARPARLNPQVYSRVQGKVHNCWLDMRDGQIDPNQRLAPTVPGPDGRAASFHCRGNLCHRRRTGAGQSG